MGINTRNTAWHHACKNEVIIERCCTVHSDSYIVVISVYEFLCSFSIKHCYQNITWHKQSGTLPPKYQTNEMTSGKVTTSTLIIPNVTEEDVGKHYCQVWANNIGVRSKKANLYYSGTIYVLNIHIRICMCVVQ